MGEEQRQDGRGVSRIIDLVREGHITPREAAMLLELRHDIERSRRRRLFWHAVLDGFALGPFWRWLRSPWCKFGCKQCRTYSTDEGIGGRCIKCGRIHGWVTRDELRRSAERRFL